MKKIDIEEAEKIGLCWKVLGNGLVSLTVSTLRTLPKNSTAYRRVDRLYEYFLRAKAELEAEWYKRIPEMNDKVLYGDRPDWHYEFMEAIEEWLVAERKAKQE